MRLTTKIVSSLVLMVCSPELSQRQWQQRQHSPFNRNDESRKFIRNKICKLSYSILSCVAVAVVIVVVWTLRPSVCLLHYFISGVKYAELQFQIFCFCIWRFDGSRRTFDGSFIPCSMCLHVPSFQFFSARISCLFHFTTLTPRSYSLD